MAFVRVKACWCIPNLNRVVNKWIDKKIKTTIYTQL